MRKVKVLDMTRLASIKEPKNCVAHVVGHAGKEYEIHWALDHLALKDQVDLVLVAMHEAEQNLVKHPDYGPVLFDSASPFLLCLVPDEAIHELESQGYISPVMIPNSPGAFALH